MSEAESGREIVVAAMNGTVFGVDVSTGAEAWRHHLGRHSLVRLAVAGSCVYALGRGTLAFIEIATGRLLGQIATEMKLHATLLVVGERIFIGDNLGDIECYSARDGRRLWRSQLETVGATDVALAFAGQVAQADRGE